MEKLSTYAWSKYVSDVKLYDGILDLEKTLDALVKALEEAHRWMVGWGSGTPSSRGAVCQSSYDAHAMVQAALKLAKEGE